ncbi:amidohydrolase [Lacihabitans sp. LS3-19]|uniref:amidohydrolase family protein n=1 Tax=Lacihabitans sp. LS3-19 TaxID=2487335 RepID=UPI0020CCFC35|nr:amidohydrolase family protein [Lacihabitans sp. LS3-19]MCP9769935.1 amidohydrolase [Lacihabitans sp. LS3-19]
MKKISILIYLIVSTFLGFAQNPTVGKSSGETIIYTGAHIFVGNGVEYNNGSLVIEKGKILAIGDGDLSSKYPNAKKVSFAGKQIYPGIISPANSLGLTEIQAVRTTSDFNEIGEINSNVRALIAYNTDSEVIPTVRSNGILLTQATPEGGLIPGRSSVMYLDGWNWEDAVLKADDGVWLNWPSKVTNSFNRTTFERESKKNENYNKTVDELHTFFNQALALSQDDKKYDNLKLTALNGVLNGVDRLYIQAGSDKEIIDAIAFCKEHAIKFPVIVGEVSSDLAISALKENNVPIIIPSTHRLPSRGDSEVWEAYKLPAKLFAKGLLVGMQYNDSYWRTRNLPFVAGNAVGHGLTKAQALSMITLNNAKILGIDNFVGSLEVGKQASYIVSEGDILDMRTSKVTNAFIRGAEVNLDDKQKRLAEKYNDKYGIK